ncbi:hypothetical protein EV182_001072 [Spiromyces aspiralis]|uniref:Uncharacterized protein n=1 Tax=Spiromyces aspiralis TaxID=68401 RepID=A0ACC1HHN0_9FUNG|nr:hypothetical protein EV182_001072 [Spiromyces aspiralis]
MYSDNPGAEQAVHELDRTDVECYMISGGKVFERYFDCPLGNHPDGKRVKVFVRHIVPIDKLDQMHKLPFLLYLQGGPGFPSMFPGNVKSAWHAAAIEHGHQLLLLDQRGTGLSKPRISWETLDSDKDLATDEQKAEYLTHFRADNIVRDCEHIRKVLTKGRTDPESQKLILLGQSFGGFCITTYLSLHPEGVSKAMITGGVPPITAPGPYEVYDRLYPRMISRNQQYYGKYPQDVERIRKIIKYLDQNEVLLPNGGRLSPRRFQQLGLEFGFAGGFDTVHLIVVNCEQDLATMGKLGYNTLNAIQMQQFWDTSVIYAILHEAIYCQEGTVSGWAAHRVRMDKYCKEFECRWEELEKEPGRPVYMTGETVHPWMLDDYAELRPLKRVGELLAEYKGWTKLYDEAQLAKNTVPVSGISYYKDMFVDVGLSEECAAKIKGFQQWVTNEYTHNGLFDDTRVFARLFDLLKGDITDL